MRNTVITAVAGIGALALAGCGTTISKAPAAPASATAAAQAASAPAPSPTSSAPLSGAPGTTFTVTGPNGASGATTVYDVTLARVDQAATLGQYDTLTNGSDHVTGAEFTITGKTGQTSDDANSDAVAVGSDGQDYTPSFDTITDGTNFNGGDFNVVPGQAVTGWVAFELPPGVTIASVQWAPGFDSQAATWTTKG